MDINDAVRSGIDIRTLKEKAELEPPVPPINTERAVSIGLEKIRELVEKIKLIQDPDDIKIAILQPTTDPAWRYSVAYALMHREADVMAAYTEIALMGRYKEVIKSAIANIRSEMRGIKPETAYQSLDSLLSPLKLRGYAAPMGWEVNRDGVFKIGGMQIAHRPIVVIARSQDADEGAMMVELAWLTDNLWHRHWVPRRSIADSKVIINLVAFGAPVNSTFAAALVQYLTAFEEENKLKTMASVSRLGWVENSFSSGGKTVGEAVALFPKDDADRRLIERFKPGGTLNGWFEAVDMVKHLEIPMLLIYASAASILLHKLNLGGFILDYYGLSETGKTACMFGAASVWGRPDFRIGAAFRWNQRITALQHNAWFCQNLPFILDETSVAYPEAIEKARYELPDGVGTVRGKPDGTTYPESSWRLICISSGEYSIAAGDSRQGAITRCLPLHTDYSWGEKTPKTQELIEKFQAKIAENYGHAGPAVAEQILALTPYELESQFSKIRKTIRTNSTRITNDIATVMLGGRLLHEAGMPGDFNKIQERALAIFQGYEIRDAARESMDAICQWAFGNRNKFIGQASHEPPNGWLGYWDAEADRIDFFHGPLQAELKRRDFNLATVRGSWVSRGWLNTVSRSRDPKRNNVPVLSIKMDALLSK